jgi:Tol biopolymer transport system component
LTCEFRDFRQANALSPAWHPSGKYLVFLGQQNAKKLGLDADALASPRRGLWTDLWLVRADGKDYWQLTRSSEQGSATLDPHFSYEGDQLLWSERVLSREGRWGTWRLRTAVLSLQRGVPRLGKIKVASRVDERGVMVAHGFSPDDKSFLVSAQLDVDPAAEALEVYLLGEGAEETRRLTRSRGGFHQYARISPRGDLVAFTSDAELGGRGSRRPSEIWLMKLDGSDKRKLTELNDAAGDRSCSVGAFAWSPLGEQIVAQVLCGGPETTREDIYRFQLSESLARAVAAASSGK